jgi:hypothetical protein
VPILMLTARSEGFFYLLGFLIDDPRIVLVGKPYAPAKVVLVIERGATVALTESK